MKNFEYMRSNTAVLSNYELSVIKKLIKRITTDKEVQHIDRQCENMAVDPITYSFKILSFNTEDRMNNNTYLLH